MRQFWVGFLAVAACAALPAPAGAAVAPFNSAANFGTAASPADVVAGDFSTSGGTGFAALSPSGLSIYLGDGGSGFNPAPGSFPLGPNAGQAIAAGDLNGDGLDDLIAGTNNGSQVYLANPSGSFTTVPGDVTGDIKAIGTGFFDADANLDVVAVTLKAGKLTATVYLGAGNGHFGTGPSLPDFATDSGATLAVADFTDDGRDDVAVATPGSKLWILLNDGSGTLSGSSQNPISTGSGPGRLAAGDVNNDGRADVIVPILNGGVGEGADVFLSDAAGHFASPTKLLQSSTGDKAVAVALGDFNNDGNLDIAVGRQLSPSLVNVLLGNGSGTSFGLDSTPTGGGNGLTGIAAADFDFDGNTDLVETNGGSSNASVFRAQPPTASVNPTSLNWAPQRTGTQSGTQTVTLTNNGPQTIGPLATITGANRDDFVRINDRCSPSSIFVPPGGTCTIGVAFKARSNGTKNATLEINSNAANSPQRVALSGTGVPAAPASQTAPSIAGNAVVGSALSCSNGTWSNSPTSFQHEWLRNGAAIPGATNPSYTVAEGDVGQQLACRVTAFNAGGSASRTSSAVTPSALAPTLSVSVRKQSLQTVLRRGLAFRAACVNPCVLSASVNGPVPRRRKKHRSSFATAARRATVGRITTTLAGGTTRTVRVRLNRAGRTGLRHRRSALLRLTVTATDPSGNPSTTRRTSVVVKRAKKRKTRR